MLLVDQATNLFSGSKVINYIDSLFVSDVTVIEYYMSDYEQYIEDSVNYSIVTVPEDAPTQ